MMDKYRKEKIRTFKFFFIGSKLILLNFKFLSMLLKKLLYNFKNKSGFFLKDKYGLGYWSVNTGALMLHKEDMAALEEYSKAGVR